MEGRASPGRRVQYPIPGEKRHLGVFSPRSSRDIASLKKVGGKVAHAVLSRMEIVGARIAGASASLRVTGALGRARTPQSGKPNEKKLNIILFANSCV